MILLRKKIFVSLFLFPFSVIIINSCSARKTYYRSYSELYVFEQNEKINFLGRLIHEDDKVSSLHYSIISDVLKYKKTDFDSLLTAAFKISYRLSQSQGNKKAGDTSFTVQFDHVSQISRHVILGKIAIKLPKDFYGYLDVSILDMNSGRRGFNAYFVDKRSVNSAQNFFSGYSNNIVHLSPFSKLGDSIILFNNRVRQAKQLFVDYFAFSQEVALPPFSSRNMTSVNKPDKKFSLVSYKGKFKLLTDLPGLYFCKIDSNYNAGFSIIAIDNSFPEIDLVEEKINSLRYLLTFQEFESAKASCDKKESAMSIWKTFSGSEKRAVGMMGEWYKRVSIANYFFTSYKEGWKTDRGMIYMVFGHPRLIEKTNKNEIWIYGELGSINSIQFEFDKVTNPLNENDYVLQRSNLHKYKWYAAVDVWRKGRIYCAY